jgi:hypothetical protein
MPPPESMQMPVPVPPQGAFPEQHSASSRSHPSLPVVTYKPPGTHQSGEAYALPAGIDSMSSLRIRPARWPLVLGFVVVVGIAVAVVVFLAFGGKDVEPPDEVAATPTPPASGSNVATNPVETTDAAPQPKKVDAAEELDENVHLDITTDPPGAVVMLGSENLGKSPIVRDHKRGDENTPMLIQLDGYEEVSYRVDLTGDYQKKVTLKAVKPEPEPAGSAKPEPAGSAKPEPAGSAKQPKQPKPPKPPKDPNPPKPPPPKPLKPPDCQIPGQQLPFDTRPLCKT